MGPPLQLAVREALAERIVRLTMCPVGVAAVAVALILLYMQSLQEPTRFLPSLLLLLTLARVEWLRRQHKPLRAAATLAVMTFMAIATGVLLNGVHAPIYSCGFLLLSLVVPVFGSAWGLLSAAGLVALGACWMVFDIWGGGLGPLRPSADVRLMTYVIYVVLALIIHGGVEQLLGDALSVAEREQGKADAARKAGAESELALHAVLDQASVGLLLLSPTGAITRLNPPAARFLRQPEADLLGQGFEHMPQWNEAQQSLIAGAMAAASTGRSSQHELSIQTGSGQPDQVYQLQFSPFHHRDGSADGVIVEVTELTDLIATRAMLAQARRLEALGKLSGGVAHDINNMLAAILGASELVRAGHVRRNDQRIENGLELIDASVQRASALIKQLLAFGRQDRFDTAMVDVNALVRELGGLFAHMLHKSIQVKVVESEQPALVKGDFTALEHALLNLALNAQDAMPDGGTLRIDVIRRASMAEDPLGACGDFKHEPIVAIRVSDTGTGMGEQVRERMFEPFFTTKPTGLGSGLGLAAVHGTLRNHGGAIEVWSEPGMGTEIELLIPALDSESCELEHLERETPALEPLHARVLLADDELSLRRTMTLMLKAEGCEVEAVPNGEALVQVLGQSPRPDVIITDLMMPGINGGRLLRLLSSTVPACPLILITGFSGEDVAGNLPTDTPHRLLRKPFTRAELMAAMRALLAGGNHGVEGRARPA